MDAAERLRFLQAPSETAPDPVSQFKVRALQAFPQRIQNLALNTADNEDAAANLERSLERRQGRSKLPGIFRKKDRAQVYAA